MDIRRTASVLTLTASLALGAVLTAGAASAVVTTTVTTVNVAAIDPVTDSGLVVAEGDSVVINASGEASICGTECYSGPDGLGEFYEGTGPANDATTPAGALVYKVGDNPWTLAGSSVTVPAGQTGTLLLALQDGIFYDDNLGSFTVDVAVTADNGQAAPAEPTDPEPTDPEPTDPEPTGPEPTGPEPADCKPGKGLGDKNHVHCFAPNAKSVK